jgi:hypothetical protein
VYTTQFVSIVLFYILFVCKFVIYYCHRVSTQLQLNISYRIIYHIPYRIISYIISYFIYHINSHHMTSYHISHNSCICVFEALHPESNNQVQRMSYRNIKPSSKQILKIQHDLIQNKLHHTQFGKDYLPQY